VPDELTPGAAAATCGRSLQPFGAHARELGERIADEEDREQLNADLATI